MSAGVPAQVEQLLQRIRRALLRAGRQLRLMEVCGTHTMAAARAGLASLLPEQLTLLSGPGCPVCVTAQADIDLMIAAARLPEVVLCTYGDMLRVPGRQGSLERARAAGGDVRVISSTWDVLRWAAVTPEKQFVLAAVGFETTAPATAAAVLAAKRQGLSNFSILAAHKRVLPAMQALVADEAVRLDGFLCPGHVSVILGSESYRPLVRQSGLSCVVSGFEPVQMLSGLARLSELATDEQPRLVNDYPEAVGEAGNTVALGLLDQVFEHRDVSWRGLGVIPKSGLSLRPAFRSWDAISRFGLSPGVDRETPGCRCGDVLKGAIDPVQCRLFGTHCTPLHPLGPCMVSSEGTCQAWFRYRRGSSAQAVRVPVTS